jgi:hypothetical protein
VGSHVSTVERCVRSTVESSNWHTMQPCEPGSNQPTTIRRQSTPPHPHAPHGTATRGGGNGGVRANRHSGEMGHRARREVVGTLAT